MYTIKEVATLLNLTNHTVRFYTDKGLVPSLKRDNSNNRIFDEEAIRWLRAAKNLKKCGMSIEDIKRYVDLCEVGDNSIHERYEMIRKQKNKVIIQLDEAIRMKEFITKKEDHYLKIVNKVVRDDTNPYSKNERQKNCLN